MKVTRRQLAAALAAMQKPGDTEEDLLKNARESVQRNGETLAKFPVPIETEPAFVFRA